MIKKDIIQRIAKDAGITQTKAKKTVDAVTDLIKEELKKENCVLLQGFGRFSVIKNAATRCRHPKTGKLIEIPSYRKAKFTPGKKLKNVLNEGNTAGKKTR